MFNRMKQRRSLLQLVAFLALFLLVIVVFHKGIPAEYGRIFVEKRFVKVPISNEESVPISLEESVALENCTKGKKLVGRLFVNETSIDWEQLKEELKFMQSGGSYQPPDCVPTVRTAIIVPYRDREEHLKLLLRQIYPMLQRQNIAFQVFVIEQADNEKFNRGKLMNVGFAEALKRANFTCFIFHDVDLIPEDDRNFYGCHLSPAHMSVAVNKFEYQLISDTLFGGVVMFTESDFWKINGFSNVFWGWGAEDDNLYQRLVQNELTLKRPAMEKARYTMIKHNQAEVDDERFDTLKKAVDHTVKDGLNSLLYKVKDSFEHALYTKIYVDLIRSSSFDPTRRENDS